MAAPLSGTARPVLGLRRLLGHVTRAEIAVAALAALVLGALVVAEPDILEAPFENARTVGFTFGGTLAAATALVVMLHLRVPAPVRIVVLGLPFVAVSWWLLSPFFLDDVVHEDFATSIADARAAADGSAPGGGAGAPASTAPPPDEGGTPSTAPTTAPSTAASTTSPTTAAPDVGGTPTVPGPSSPGAPEPTTAPPTTAPAGPVLLGAGSIRGLAGHDGTGDAGIFRLPDGSLVVRLEHLDIDNGPDLELYLVPGADQTSLADGAVHLGHLRGNIGDQTYDVPAAVDVTPGDWTVLVWCEAFSVEFVGATVTVA
jgi:hypothetical protein